MIANSARQLRSEEKPITKQKRAYQLRGLKGEFVAELVKVLEFSYAITSHLSSPIPRNLLQPSKHFLGGSEVRRFGCHCQRSRPGCQILVRHAAGHSRRVRTGVSKQALEAGPLNIITSWLSTTKKLQKKIASSLSLALDFNFQAPHGGFQGVDQANDQLETTVSEI